MYILSVANSIRVSSRSVIASARANSVFHLALHGSHILRSGQLGDGSGNTLDRLHELHTQVRLIKLGLQRLNHHDIAFLAIDVRDRKQVALANLFELLLVAQGQRPVLAKVLTTSVTWPAVF